MRVAFLAPLVKALSWLYGGNDWASAVCLRTAAEVRESVARETATRLRVAAVAAVAGCALCVLQVLQVLLSPAPSAEAHALTHFSGESRTCRTWTQRGRISGTL